MAYIVAYIVIANSKFLQRQQSEVAEEPAYLQAPNQKKIDRHKIKYMLMTYTKMHPHK